MGDTSAETQTDTLTRGNYSADLVPYIWDNKTAFDGKKTPKKERKKKKLNTGAAINCTCRLLMVERSNSYFCGIFKKKPHRTCQKCFDAWK